VVVVVESGQVDCMFYSIHTHTHTHTHTSACVYCVSARARAALLDVCSLEQVEQKEAWRPQRRRRRRPLGTSGVLQLKLYDTSPELSVHRESCWTEFWF